MLSWWFTSREQNEDSITPTILVWILIIRVSRYKKNFPMYFTYRGCSIYKTLQNIKILWLLNVWPSYLYFINKNGAKRAFLNICIIVLGRRFLHSFLFAYFRLVKSHSRNVPWVHPKSIQKHMREPMRKPSIPSDSTMFL